jgi:hypothetical protein
MEKIMENKKYERNRKVSIGFFVTPEERQMIERRMAQSGIRTLRAYMLKMAIDGQVITVELESVKKMVSLLSNATNNINQIAKRANESRNVHTKDVEKLHLLCEELWSQTREILNKLSDIIATN